MKQKIRLLVFLCVYSIAVHSQNINVSDVPKLVDLVGPLVPHRDFTSFGDMNEIYFTVQGYNRTFSAIARIVKKDGKWSSPVVMPFSGRYNDLEPSLSPDGKRLYFSSNRPTLENPAKRDMDIWYVEQNSDGWSDPVNLGASVNTSSNEFYPSVSSSGSIYFTAQYDRAKGPTFIIANLKMASI